MHQRTHALCAPPFDAKPGTWEELTHCVLDAALHWTYCISLSTLLAHSGACSACGCVVYTEYREQTVHRPQCCVASAPGTSYLPTRPQYPPVCRSNGSTLVDDGPQPAQTVSISGLYPGGAMLRVMSRSGHRTSRWAVTLPWNSSLRRAPWPSDVVPPLGPHQQQHQQQHQTPRCCLQSRSRASLKHHAAAPVPRKSRSFRGQGGPRRSSSPLILADLWRFADVGRPNSTFSIGLPRLAP